MKAHSIFLFIAGVIGLLSVVCLVLDGQGVNIGIYTLRFPSVDDMMRGNEHHVSADSLVLQVEQTMEIAPVDSASLAREDSLRFYKDFFENNIARFHLPNDSVEYLFPLFESLDNAMTQHVHIMHYGDSQIEGDRITGYLRLRLQERFGGAGPGLLPLVQPIGATSVAQRLSDTIPSYYAGGMMGDRDSHNDYGAMAQFARLETPLDSGITLTITTRRSSPFRRIILYASDVDSLNAEIGGTKKSIANRDKTCSLSWILRKDLKKVSVAMAGKANILGLAVDGETGVTASNIPMRGSDGTFFTRISKSAVKYMLDDLNTRLVLLEFGGNALPCIRDSVGVEKFCKGFAKQIRYINDVCPEARIIVIGPADMSTKINGRLQTHSMLPRLVSRLRETTVETGAAYWDMYDAMGGYNSMLSWVEHKPQWAATDYIHFTPKGADRIAELLWKSLMVYYDYACFMRKEDHK